ncbi:MAG: CYTH and CHAD domain-containing protein [Betaproteobacteria bacterium]|nr:CYTH and CHAD domain-containing protein [Betaproteobacteria bacterium]
MDHEIELKLAIDPADAVAFRQIPLLCEKSIAGPTRRKVLNVYFDTPGLVLKHHSMALRLRKTAGKWLQTLKTAGTATGGLHQRGEWEYPLRAPQLDLALFRETPLATLAQSKALHHTLKPLFTTDFFRTTWRVEISPSQRVEVALDLGVIRCGEREAIISEVEIELLEGNAAAVFDVALALVGEIAMRPSILSKAERGYQLVAPEAIVPRHAVAIPLKRKWPPHQAMRVIIAACLDHFDANFEGALTRDDPEFIHQLRVALRRLRSAIRIFRPAHAGHFSAELKWLAAAIGEARDWDVFVTRTLPALLGDFGDPRLAGKILALAMQRQAHARAAARVALASSRAATLVMSIARWISVPGAVASGDSQSTMAGHGDEAHAPATHGLARFASHEISRRHRRLMRVKGALDELSPEARHRVRIDAKRLRYAMEFLAGLFPGKRVARYLKVIGEIQEGLGEANDDAVASRLIESLSAPKPLVDFAAATFAKRTQKTLSDLDARITALKKIRHFWND